MNIKTKFNYGTHFIKKISKVKLNPNTIGYIHAGGQISFATQDAALLYAKNRIVKALNSNKPFERGILIDDNVICVEVNGHSHSVLIPTQKAKGHNLITAHGHPDAIQIKEGGHPSFLRNIFSKKISNNSKIKQNGITYPISIPDYRNFMLNPNERKTIVYNSKGEYSSLTKKESGITMNHQEFNEISNEYSLTVESTNNYFAVFKYIYNSIRHFLQSSSDAEKTMIEEANILSKKIHEFLSLNTDRYGIIYETNYSNLIK